MNLKFAESVDMSLLQILIIIVLSLASGFLYTAGGSGKYPFWFRETGVMVCECLALISLGFLSWWLILVAGLTYGVQTTYFKKKGTDARWWNWCLVGLAFSISVLPMVISNSLWLGFVLRILFLTPAIITWSELVGKDWLEEGGRGGLQIATLPLLLIGA